MPRFKYDSKVGDCVHLGDTCGRHRPCKGSGDNLEAMDNLVLCGWRRDRKVGMAEYDCIGDNLAFGVSDDKFEAVVRQQRWTNVEVIFGLKIPRPSRCWLGMDEDGITNWTKGVLLKSKTP